ncbi:MAG TPA: ABC transporter substrate-binding protein [Dehalococcoidia bacterium]|nr:ABC transporter substrate-binding protein [Dehalococcoidia bacterium]
MARGHNRGARTGSQAGGQTARGGERREVSRRFFLGLAFGAPAAAALLAACGGDGEDAGGQRVRVQLDWTPNTNHIGIYLGLAKGWYRDEGLDVQVLPYADANPDTIVANGNAEVGISFPANVIFSRAAGLDLVSIAAVLQSNPTELAVLDSSDIRRPRDFDGRTYAGFGLPYEEPQIRTVIKADGGKGDFKTAVLSTAAYEALYEKRADFTEIFTTWEGIEAELRGIKLRTFRYDAFGVPDFPGVVLVARRNAVSQTSPLRKFLEVTRRGYELAARSPDDASQAFIDYLPGTFPEPDLVRRSTRMLASFFVNKAGQWGTQDASKWQAYTRWILEQGIVKDRNDKVIDSESALGGPLFTNELLPGG